MTDEARAADPGDSGSAREQVVTEDKREQGTGPTAADAAAQGGAQDSDQTVVDAEVVAAEPAGPEAPDAESGTAEAGTAESITTESGAESGTADGAAATSGPEGGSASGAEKVAAGGLGAELEALRNELDERLRDLQRVSAEYANYRKRVERDRAAVVEQAMAMVITSLLPILDDLDRAREHDDLVGPFASVAEQLNSALAKFGLSGFGEAGDAFDPTRHEAVTHQTSAEVTAPTCISVMRRGYLLGDRLLRAALVSVADPE